MSEFPKNQQIEFETFGKNPKPDYSYLNRLSTGGASAQHPPISVIFSHQSVIVLLICVLLSLVASFTLGVEKGKLLAKNAPLAEKTAAEAPLAPAIAEKQQLTAALAETKDAVAPAAPAPAGASAVAKNENATPAASGYAIQIASVKSAGAAKNLAETLLKKGVTSFTKPSGKYIVVLAGSFSKREEAQFSLKELKKTYTDCFIRKI